MSLEKKLEAAMQRQLEAALFGGATTNQQAQDTTLDLRKLLPEWEKMFRNFRRENVTFMVDLVHPGPAIKYDTPHDGVRFEMSWQQANALHQEWPLRLHKVLSGTAAEFVPVSGIFGEIVPKMLPLPPYEMPDDELG